MLRTCPALLLLAVGLGSLPADKLLVAAAPGQPLPVKLQATLEAHRGLVYVVAFSPDGRTLASAGVGGIKLWNAADGKFRADLAKSDCRSLAFSPDSKTLAAATNGRISMWEVATLKEKTAFGMADESIAFSPDGKLLATAAVDSTVRFWDASSGEKGAIMKGHTSVIIPVAFSPDGKTLASAARDKTIRLWDVATGTETASMTGLPQVVFFLAFTPDGKTLASSGADGIKLWDLATNKGKSLSTERTGSLAFSPDGKLVVSAYAGVVRDAVTGDERANLNLNRGVQSVAFSPDGKRVATGGADGRVRLWELLDAEQAKASYDAHMKEGRAAMKDKKYLDAVKEFENAVRAKPNDTPATTALKQVQGTIQGEFNKFNAAGSTAMAKKKYADAVKAYEEALKLMPDNDAAAMTLEMAKKKLPKE